MRIHILSNFVVPMDRALTGDAFNQLAFRLADGLLAQGHEVFVYGSAHGLREPPFCSQYVSILQEKDFESVISPLGDVGGYAGFNSGQYLSPGAGGRELKEEILRLRSLCLQHLLVQAPPRVRCGDVFLTLWEHTSYFRGLFDILWQKGAKVVQGYCMGGSTSSTLPFRYSIFCSRAMLEDAQKNIGESEAPKMWQVMSPLFLPESSNTTESSNVAESSERPALYLGRIQVEKGAWEFYRVAYYNPDREFWMAGQGEAWIDGRRAGRGDFPLKKRGCLAIARCDNDPLWINLADVPNLSYLGFADPEERRRLMKEAGALIQLSQYKEPYGWNVAEAHLCGLPTVTTKRGAFLETVEEGVDGFYLGEEVSHDETPAAVRALLRQAEALDREAVRRKALQTYDPQALLQTLTDFLQIISDRSPEEDYLLKR